MIKSSESPKWLFVASSLNMLLGLCSIPLLSWLIGSEVLGQYQEFLAFAIIAGPIAAGRLEAGVLSGDNGPAFWAGILVAVAAFVFTLAFLPLYFERFYMAGLLPFFILSYALMVLAKAVGLKQKKYKLVSILDVVYTFSYLVLPAAFFKFDDPAFLIGFAMVVFQFLYFFVFWGAVGVGRFCFHDTVVYIRKKCSMSFSLVALTLVNGISLQLPIFFMSERFEYALMGAFLLANRVLNIPVAVVSQPVASYLESVFSEKNFQTFFKCMLGCLFLSVLFSVTCIVVSEIDMQWFFGEGWDVVSIVLVFSVLPKALQMINLPAAKVMNLTRYRALALLITVFFIPVRWALMEFYGVDVEGFLMGMMIGATSFYVFYTALALWVVKNEYR